MAKPPPEETLETLLAEAEKEVKTVETSMEQADRAVLQEIASLEAGKTATELEIERDILHQEGDLTVKIETELWNGAHIALLPYFYETYTIRAGVEPRLQERYNKATLTTLSRFKALGTHGLAMVTPIADFIRNHASYSPADRHVLEHTLLQRIVSWLRLDIVPESRPRQVLSRTLETVVADIIEAEQVFARMEPENVYMEGSVQMAAVKAIRTSLFLPNLVKIRLLQGLSGMAAGDIYDIGTFLLWETRKSSHNRQLLVYTMLRILKSLNSSLLQA